MYHLAQQRKLSVYCKFCLNVSGPANTSRLKHRFLILLSMHPPNYCIYHAVKDNLEFNDQIGYLKQTESHITRQYSVVDDHTDNRDHPTQLCLIRGCSWQTRILA